MPGLVGSILRGRGPWVGVLVVVGLLACGGNEKPPPGGVCTRNTDCNNPLSCTFGRCHETCREARDCPAGNRCVKSPAGAVCQLDAVCTYRSDCQQPLICALDRQCRSQCLEDIDCPTRTQRCVKPDLVCAEPEEIDPGGRLKQAQATPVPDRPEAGAPPPADAGADAATTPDAAVVPDTAVTPDAPATPDASPDATPDAPAPPDLSPDTTPAAPDTAPPPPDLATDVVPAVEAQWGTNAGAYRGMMGLQVKYRCPAMGTPGSLWGTDTYTDDSSVCTAAVHAGLITFAGGEVTIEIRPGQASYVGSLRNNITSASYATYAGSFVFFPYKIPNCGNLAREGDESDADCGGSCPPCGPGKLCGKAADCADMVCSTRCVLAGSWDSNATAFRGMNGARIPHTCPPNGTPRNVWGTDIYTDDSSICTAAVHAGKLTLAAGGTVTIEIVGPQGSYVGSVRNGITSSSYGSYAGSMSFP